MNTMNNITFHVGEDFIGTDFSKTGIHDTTFVNCDMRKIILPTSPLDLENVKFVDCIFDSCNSSGELLVLPLYEAKYRFCLYAPFQTIRFKENCVCIASFTDRDLSAAIDPLYIVDSYSDGYYGYKILETENECGETIYVLARLRIHKTTPAALFWKCKCRAERAVVTHINDFNGVPYNKAYSCYYPKRTVYEVGKEVVADEWDPDIMNECSGGIHFFLTASEAWKFCVT